MGRPPASRRPLPWYRCSRIKVHLLQPLLFIALSSKFFNPLCGCPFQDPQPTFLCGNGSLDKGAGELSGFVSRPISGSQASAPGPRCKCFSGPAPPASLYPVPDAAVHGLTCRYVLLAAGLSFSSEPEKGWRGRAPIGCLFSSSSSRSSLQPPLSRSCLPSG